MTPRPSWISHCVSSMAASSSSRSRMKDVLLEHVSRDIKALHVQQSDLATMQDALSNNGKHTKSLCDHLDLVLMHGLIDDDTGYWDLSSYFSRKDAIGILCSLSNVKTWKGRGRAWICLALNEQSLECYFRMFVENQSVIQQWYSRDAFLRDIELLLVIQTLLSGLDYVTFDLSLDEDYFDTSASPRLLKGVPQAKPLDFNINPSFVSLVNPEVQKKQQQSAQLSASLPASLSSLPAAAPVPITAPILTSTSVSTDDTVTTINAEPTTPPAEVVTESPVETTVETTVVTQDTTVVTQDTSTQPDTGYKHEPTLLERMSLADSSSIAATAGAVAAETDGVAVTSRQRKSKGRKKKRRPKETSGEEGKHSRRGSEQQQSPTKEKEEEEAPITTTQSTTAEQHDTVTHSNTNVNQDTPEIAAVDEVVDADIVRDSVVAVVGVDPDEQSAVQPEKESMEEPENRPQLNRTNLFDSNMVDEEEERTVGHSNSNSNQPEELYPTRTPFISGKPGNEEIDSDLRDLEATAAMAVAARRGSRQRGRSDAISSPVRSSHDYCMIDESSPGEIERASNSPLVTGESARVYDARPKRQSTITEWAGQAADVVIDDNTRLLLALNVFFDSEENFERLVQVRIPAGSGCYQTAYVTVTDEGVYLVQKDGTEGSYSRMLVVRFTQLRHMIIGLSWQSLGLAYTMREEEPVVGRRRESKYHKQILITGNEAVSKSLANLIRNTASRSPSFSRSIPLNRDDESRIDAIERELIKLGSHTSMDVVRYSLVHWEQLMGEPPSILPTVTSVNEPEGPLSGTLQVKGTSLLGSGWRSAYFVLKVDTLFQYNAEGESSPKASYPLRGLKFGGCTRAPAENKMFAFKMIDSNGSSTLLAADSEEEMTTWMQSLCLAACGAESPKHSPVHSKGGMDCAVMLTNSGLHVLLEDWSNESVRLATSVTVEEVTEIGVDKDLPLYCTLAYEDSSSGAHGLWMLCFSSEYELGQFEAAFSDKWKENFEVDITFVEMLDPTVKARAKRAVELMMSSSSRSDSITRGRTEHT